MPHLRSRRVLAAASALAVAVSSASAAEQVYDAEAAVQSPKRGVAVGGTLSASDFTALNPGVSWWYNYSPTPNQTVPTNAGMTFFPEVWGSDSGELSSLSSYLSAGNRPPEILTINEPNISGQAVMTPAQAATTYANVEAIASPYGIPVSGPQMPAGGDTGITSTSQYLTDFFQDCAANNTTVAGTGAHIYDNFGGFTYNLQQAEADAGGRPVSVTEFAYYDATSVEQQLQYMIPAVDELENDPNVPFYSWFIARSSSPSSSPYISLLNTAAGSLSTLGQAYVSMPVHSTSIYYRPNGRLQSDRYTTTSNATISATNDTNAFSFADMNASASNALVNYNLYVAQAGIYTVNFRVGGASGLFTLLDGSATFGSVNLAYTGTYQTLGTEVNLPAGYDSITLQMQNSGEAINYLQFGLSIPQLTWDNAPVTNPSDGKTWDIASNNNWNSGTAPTVYTDGADVIFNDANNGNYAVTLNTVVHPGAVTVINSAGDYTISGAGGIAGTGSLTKSGTRTLTLSTPNSYSGGTNVSNGLLLIEPTGSTTSALPTGALSISGSGEVQLADNVTAGTALATSNVVLTSLSIAGNGTLDIGNNRIIIDYSSAATDPIASIAVWIANGYYGLPGPAVISSDIATDDTANGLSYGIGYADGADGVVAGLPSGEIEIMFTLLGDANLDGTVNSEDFTLFSEHLGRSGMSWDDGDFNYDGTANAEDFTLFSHNLGQTASLAAAAGDLELANGDLSNVPEPMSAGMTLMAGLGMLRRRRRSS
jgi:autotransporter-associated beta strand protein